MSAEDRVIEIGEEAVALVAKWLQAAREGETSSEHASMERLSELIEDPNGVGWVMAFVDRIARAEDHKVAAHQLHSLVQTRPTPEFFSWGDGVLLSIGSRLAPMMPGVVMPTAMRRMRQLVGHMVVDAEPKKLNKHLVRRQEEGYRLNVNLLGEAVLGQKEAAKRLERSLALLRQPDIDYVSIKLSSVAAQLNHWAFEDCVRRVSEPLRLLLREGMNAEPATFVNLDMEEYHDLELTLAAFKRVLEEPEFEGLSAGIVLQCYLPDSFAALEDLVAWSNARHQRTGGEVKIRLVKGANLAMEKVDAAMHGWRQAPYTTKHHTDANYKRCVDWVMSPERLAGVRIGVASHNLFDLAFAHLLSIERGVAQRVEIEMLQGMAEAQARAVKADASSLLLYTPVVAKSDFDVAISYLFRRLEENAAPENFLRALFGLQPGTERFEAQRQRFVDALAQRWVVPSGPRRTQDQSAPKTYEGPPARFENEPDTDPALPANRRWAEAIVAAGPVGPRAPMTTTTEGVDAAVAEVVAGRADWGRRSAAQRREVLHRVAHELSLRRGELLQALVYEGHKTIAEGDPEISEAIDFARYYAERALELEGVAGAAFEPFGTVLVVPPWNFPVAIPCGGVMAALAAGNTVLFKPAPQTPKCAEIVAEAAWAAGVPRQALHFIRTPDDEVGKHLVTHPEVGAVILTGAWETAQLFRSWKPDLRLFAETSGKNALIITPSADIDLAVDHLVKSAFGHAGQKCSAASLGICVGDLYGSERFRRQLQDAVESIVVGPAHDLATVMNPLIMPPEDKLRRGLTQLEEGEEWLVEPRALDEVGQTWSPGVRLGVQPGSWFHQTECFGPVLGLMHAESLDEAIALQNGVEYGLTGGIHTLDPTEVDYWLERVEVGNAYVNRKITGAIVQRQPFGGWKRSCIGPGAKAGGPNYVAQLGTWRPVMGAEPDQRWWWENVYSKEHDPTGLFCEANILRYRPLPRVLLRLAEDGSEADLELARRAARRVGSDVTVSRASSQSASDVAARLESAGLVRIRVIGTAEPEIRRAANALGIHVSDDPVTPSGRLELLHYLREQAISRTLHRFGNLVR